MTIRQAIDRLDEKLPNDRSEAEKIEWLSRLDFHAYNDVMRVHTPIPPEFSGYTPETPVDTRLLIDEPFDAVYPLYMMAEIFFLTGEYARYNNACDYFNRVFIDWTNSYHTAHLPVTGVCVQLFGR